MQNNEIVIECSDLGSAQDFYTDELGFRLETIFPADGPRVAVLSGHGIQLHLRQIGAIEPAYDGFDPAVFVQRHDECSWGDGRAGMQYRDLVPHRHGGKYIASHIRIPVGGPVPDYVHYHNIRFQLIYCYRGWVRVVYEDQGPPFDLQAGDLVLQPPHIRHRVLECSDNMEVIEIAGPAEHETHVDHDLTLPTKTIQKDRDFAGQQFVFHQKKNSTWAPAKIDGMLARESGIAKATDGIASAVVLRATGDLCQVQAANVHDLCFNFVLAGSASLDADKSQPVSLSPGDTFLIPQDCQYSLRDVDSGFEILQVTARE